jgi:hypothetical protein
MLQRRIKQVLGQISALDDDTLKITGQIDLERAKLGGVNAAKQNSDAIDKQVRVLENRLDKVNICRY